MRQATSTTTIVIVFFTSFASGAIDPPSAGEQLARMVARFNEIEQSFSKELRAANTSERRSEEITAANDRYRKLHAAWAEEALALIRKYPAESEAVPLIEKCIERSEASLSEFIGIIKKHHWTDPRIGKLIHSIYQASQSECRTFALDVANNHADRNTRARASLTVGELAKWRLTWDLLPSSSRPNDPLSSDRRNELQQHAETYLSKSLQEYADVTVNDGPGKIGPRAKAALVGLKNLPNLIAGKPAPEIIGRDLDGKELKLSENKGKVVLLVFWASWCGPCMGDVPHERELVERFRDRPFVLIGVNGDAESEKARAAVKKAQITWRSFFCDGDGFHEHGSIPAAWNVVAWPTTYVIDHEGIIRHRNLRGKELDEPLSQLIVAAEKGKNVP